MDLVRVSCIWSVWFAFISSAGAAPMFTAQPVPEQGATQSKAKALYIKDDGVGGEVDRTLILADLRTGLLLDRAGVWDGVAAEPELLPELFPGNATTGNDVSCDSVSGLCVVGGSATDPAGKEQPVLWEKGELAFTWTVSPLALPAQCEAGAVVRVQASSIAVGWCADSIGVQKPVVWQAPSNAPTLLPITNYTRGVATASAQADFGLRISGTLNYLSGELRPVVWSPDPKNVGQFGVPVELPLLTSGTQGAAHSINEVGVVAGYSTNQAGNRQAVIWEWQPAPQEWQLTELPTLPGAVNSETIHCLPNLAPFIYNPCTGTSDGRPTLIETGGVARRAYAVDDLVIVTSPQPPGNYTGTCDITSGNQVFAFALSCNWEEVNVPGSAVAGGAPGPHAHFLISLPEGIPAVSSWGLVAMALLILAAGTVMLRRHRLVCS